MDFLDLFIYVQTQKSIYIYFKETFEIMMYLLSDSEVYCTGSRLSKLSNLYIFKLYYNYYLYILKSILEVDFLDLFIYVQTQKSIYIYFKETFEIMMYLLSDSEVYCTGSRLSKLSNLYIFKLYYNYYLYILKSILEVNFLNLCICIYVQTQNYTKIIYT